MAHDPHTLVAEADDPRDPESNLHLLQIAWRRKSLILLGLVVGVVVGGLYYAQATPIYQSAAQVLVVKKRPDAVTGVDTRQLAIEDYVSTHQVLVKSPLIIQQAIKKHDLGALQSFQGEKEDLTEVIIKAVTVTRNKGPSGNNNVLDLAFRAKVPEESSLVLDAIIESYKDFLDETYRNMSDDTLELITKARGVLQKDLAHKESAYREFRQQSPLLSRGKEGNNLWQDRLIGIEAKRSTLLLRRAELQGHLTAIENAQKQGLNREALVALMSELTSRSESEHPRRSQPLTLQDQLFPLLTEEQKLLEKFGPNHPQVQAIRKQIQVARDFYSSPSAAWRATTEQAGKKGDEPGVDPVEAHVDYLKQQLNHVKASEQQLTELFEKEHADARKLTSYEIQDEALRTDIVRTQQLYDGIIKRLQDVGLVKDVGGYDAKTIASPTFGKKVAPKVILVFPIAAFLGLLFGFGLAYLADVTDKSFRSPEEIRRRLGLPVVGYIPHLTADAEAVRQAEDSGLALDPLLCTYFRSKTMEAEAFRGVRTALYFSTHGERHKVIQITSPNSGDGKSTLAANLAVSIAQSGKQVVLIDADLRKPRIHKVFGLSANVGLGSIIDGEAEPKDALQESCIAGLSILPCGPIPPNPAELLTSPRFKDLLDLLREQFDFVVIDTPPLLAVTDPSVVAPRADGVILAIRITKNGRPAAERAKEILATLGATVIGVVVNGVDRNTGPKGYGYGNYGYGYGGYGSEATAERPKPEPAAAGTAAKAGG